MIYSNRQDTSPAIVTSGLATKGILEESYICCLQMHYKSFFADYSSILSEYERASIRATNTRNKSLFPDKVLWNPPMEF